MGIHTGRINITGIGAAVAEPLAKGYGFGTAPVFLASLSTILGAIMFLRFGYAVGHQGLAGALMIVLLGHLVTIPTALAIAEIATNRRVEGGGEYFIISRSFGSSIGSTIGLSLYSSQAISVAFYMIAFAEAFRPLTPMFERLAGIPFDPRYISLPATGILILIILARGAKIGVALLWGVVVVLALALALFFTGSPLAGYEVEGLNLFAAVEGADSFMLVFAICFPAFTGMTAGVGLSGDLRNPRRSIPLGIMAATATGLVVYAALIIKLALSAPPETLAEDQLVMSRIALWGPIIPIGLGCATLSSAIGSILVAPRTLQALGRDRGLPLPPANDFVSVGSGQTNEPRNATLVTAVVAIAFVAMGDVDFVARIISMFFMVTYGSLCTISFLEHFAARPSYRPSFRSRWYLSLLGAAASFLLMLQMDPLYALLAILTMVGVYRFVVATRRGESDDLAAIARGVMTQLTRTLQITLQKSQERGEETDWRPSIVTINERSFARSAPLQLLAWLCYRHGFGTYLHLIRGRLTSETYAESRSALRQLLVDVHHRGRGVYVDTIISPSMRTALAQCLQFPGISGMENNTLLFEFTPGDEPGHLGEIAEGCQLAATSEMNSLVLRHGAHFFGNRAEIHVYLTWNDHSNANLMILLSFILAGHPAWQRAEIHVFAAFPMSDVEEQTRRVNAMIAAGRLPISEKNVVIIGTDDREDYVRLVEEQSAAADLAILGFGQARLREVGPSSVFSRFPALRDVLFVNAKQRILID